MSLAIYKYRVYCVEEDSFVYTWNDKEPTVCPNNASHKIDPDQTVIVGKIEEDVITIKEENTPTGGNFRTETVIVEAEANETKVVNYQWKYPINVFSLNFATKDIHEDSKLKIEVGPQTIIGIITQDVSVGDKTITVSDSVLENIYVGYRVHLFDGKNSFDCGEVLIVNKEKKTLTFADEIEIAFDSSSPTYVQQTVCIVQDYMIGPASNYSVGKSKIGGSYIPANTDVRLTYENIAPETVKLVLAIEYLY
jgi:hypothetical protein